VYVDKIKEVPFEKIVYRDRDVPVEVEKVVERVVDRYRCVFPFSFFFFLRSYRGGEGGGTSGGPV
jgi:hypothetical protein